MKRLRISAKDLLSDIRRGATDRELMDKYGLSSRSLPKVKMALLERALALRAGLRSPNTPRVCERSPVNAKLFLDDFRKHPDDLYLMEKYSLNAEQLQKVYVTLIEQGFLGEYEYNCRENKAPQLAEEQLPPAEDLTAVSIVDDLSGSLKDYFAIPASSLSKNRARPSGKQDPLSSDVPAEARRSVCPNCGKKVDPGTDTTCMYCGVVFAKAEQRFRRDRIAIWF